VMMRTDDDDDDDDDGERARLGTHGWMTMMMPFCVRLRADKG
jgi:hypothetical protein